MVPVHVWILVSVLLCARQCQSGKVMLVKTSGDQTKSVFLNDKGVQVAGEKSLIMDIKACAEAVVQFAQTQQLTGGFFEVYLGSRDNSMSMVRFSGKKKKESVRGSPLDCKDFRTFWFSWEDEGTLHVGSGSVIGVREFLSLEVEETVEIHYVVVYTAMGNEGEWRVLRDSRPEFVHPNRDGSTVIDVREDTPAHGVIYELKARDPDEDDITYHVIGQYSDVFGVSGTNLKILKRLDFETKQNYVVTISASDGKHEVRQSMMVSVVDLVDEVPVIGLPVLTTILEELPVGTPIGQLATVVDRDKGAKLKYSLRGRDSQYFNIDAKTGDVRMRKRLDRDKRNGRHVLDQLYLTVDDQIHLQEKKLHVSVIDINDNPPMFGKTIYRVTVKENMFKDMVIANLSCVDIDDAANSVFSLVISSVKAQTAPIKTKKPNKPSSATPDGLGEQSSKPTTSDPLSVSGSSSGHPEHKSPTAPAITDGRPGKETTSHEREWESGISKELKKPWFPLSDTTDSRGTRKRDQFDSSASHNTGGKDVVGRNVRSTKFDEFRMTPNYFSDNSYDESDSRKGTQTHDSSYQTRRNSEHSYKDNSVGRKERPRYDSNKRNDRHGRDKGSSERVREESGRYRERWKPEYDRGEHMGNRGDDHHSREAGAENRRNYPERPDRHRNEYKRSSDYYYDYDSDPDRYRPHRRPRYNGYRRRRWHDNEVRGSSWAGDSENQKASVRAPVPDNWADLLKHDEPYLGPRHDDEPKSLEDVLKPVKRGESISNDIKDEEPLNIITKADQDKIRKQMESSVAGTEDVTRETTVRASDTTTTTTTTTNNNTNNNNANTFTTTTITTSSLTREAEDFDSPIMPYANFADSIEESVDSEDKTSGISDNTGIDSSNLLEDDLITTTPVSVTGLDSRTNTLGFIDDDSVTTTISLKPSISAPETSDGYLFDGDDEEEDGNEEDNGDDDEGDELDFGDTQTGTTDFPNYGGILTTVTTNQKDKTDNGNADYGGLDETYDYNNTPNTDDGDDSDGIADASDINDYDNNSFDNGTPNETSTIADTGSSIDWNDSVYSKSNSSANTSSTANIDYDALYDKFGATTDDSLGSDEVTKSTNDITVTKGAVSDISNNGVHTNENDSGTQTNNQGNNIGFSTIRKKRSSLKQIFGGKFRRYLKKNRKLRKAKAALRVIRRMLANSRRRNRQRDVRWERVIRKFLKEIARNNKIKSDVSGRDLLRDVLINHRYLNDNRERLTNEIPLNQVYYSDPAQTILAGGDQDDYLAHKMGQKLIPEQQYIQSLFRHFNKNRQHYSDGHLKQRYPFPYQHNRPNRQRDTETDRQTSQFPYFQTPRKQTSPNHNDRLRFDINEAFPLERHGFEPLKYESEKEGLIYEKLPVPHRHHYVRPSSEDGTQQPAIPSSFVGRNGMKPDVQLDYFKNANPFNRNRGIGSKGPEYDSDPDNYHTEAPADSHEISNNNAGLGREEISAARLKVYEELGLEPNLENLDYDYVDPTGTESNAYQTDDTQHREQTPTKHRLTGKHGPSYSNVVQSNYHNKGVPYNPQHEMQGYRHYEERGNPKGYNRINSHAKPMRIHGDSEEQNSLEETSNAVDPNHYVGPPLSSLAKLHIEEDTNTDKVPMNDFVLVPKDAIAKSLEREADALGTPDQPSVNSDYKYQNRIGKRNRKGQGVDSYFENRQNVNNLKSAPTGNGQISPRVLYEKSFPRELIDLAREDNIINSSPHFPPVSAYSKGRFLEKLSQTIFNRNKDNIFVQSKQRPKQVDATQNQRRASDTSNLKDFLQRAISERNAKIKPRHMQQAVVGTNGKERKRDQVPNPETSHINTESYLRHLTRFKSAAPENSNQGSHSTIANMPEDTNDSESVSNTNTRGKTWASSPNLWKHSLKSSPTFSRRRLPKRDTAKMAKPMFEARGLSIWANSKTVDFDTMGDGDHTYTLTVLAIDRPEYGSPQTGTTMVLVQVLPVNEFTPEWTDPPVNDSGWFPSVLVRENVTLGTKLITLGATDRDGGEDGRITYTLTEVRAANGKSAMDSFAIEPSTGTLRNAVKLDRDPQTGGVTHYDLVITASDNGETPFSIQGRMRVSLMDVNDNPPKFIKPLYEAILPSEWTELSRWKLQLAVVDRDRKAAFKFRIVKGDSSKFSIDENTGVMRVRGTPDKTLPYKVLTVSVSDGGTPELTSSTQVIIHTQKYSFDQVRAAIDARTKSSGPWVFKMLSGVFGFILLFMVIFYITKKYGLCSSVVRPDLDKPDDDVSVNRSRVINIAPPPDVTNRADNSGIEHVDVRSGRVQHHGGVTSLQSVDEGQDGHAQESISSMRKSHRY